MLPLLLQLLGGLLGAYLVYATLLFAFYKFKLRRFPGPLSFPVVGSLWDTSFINFYSKMMSLYHKHGPVVLFFAGSRPTLLLCDPKVVRRVLADSKTFYKGQDYTEYFSRMFGQGLVTSNGETHRHGKQILGKYFIRSSIVQYTPMFNAVTRKMIEQFLLPCMKEEKIESGVTVTRAHMNMELFFARLALRAFMRFSCAVDCSVDPRFEEEMCHTVSDASHAVIMTILTSQPNHDIFPHTKRVHDARRFVASYFSTCLREREAALQRGERHDDMLQALLEDKTLSEKEREDHFVTIICAGHDTTAFFMSYFSFLMAKHPHVQQKLREHIEEVLGPANTPEERDKEVTADDVAKLKYLQCVMMETLRLYPVIPNVSRECAQDVHIKDDAVDVVIPANVNLVLPLFLLNRDKQNWESPEVFDPDRFAQKESADFTLAQKGFFPFAFGSRICVGNTLAQIESGIAIVHLLRRFVFSEEPGFRPKIRGGISSTTSNGMSIIVAPRELTE